jgi:hypothetical protein
MTRSGDELNSPDCWAIVLGEIAAFAVFASRIGASRPGPATVISRAPLASAAVGTKATPTASVAATRMRRLIVFLSSSEVHPVAGFGFRVEIAGLPVGNRRLGAMMGS